MNKVKLYKVNDILVDFINKNDTEKKWVFQIGKSEEWLNTTYKNSNKFSKDLYKELTRFKKQILYDLDNIGLEVRNEILKYYIEHVENLRTKFEASVYNNYIDIANISMKEVIEMVGEASVGISFDLLNEQAKVFLENKKIKFSTSVADTTHKAIIRELTIGFELGESIQELAERIKNMPEFGIHRATLVARTEIISSSNAGTLIGYEESGVATGKEWLCTADGRTRSSHKSASGQRVGIKEPFIVDGDKLMYPGDNSLGAKASNVIQCRCCIIPILKDEVI